MSEIRIVPDTQQLAAIAAEDIVSLAQEAVEARGKFSVALSGGSTPRALYTLLSAPPYNNQIDWAKVHIFWGDERCVPPDHVDSSYRMANEALLSKVAIPPANIRRMKGESVPAEAAAEYEQLLHKFFPENESRFDLILLGMGDDGHTASLFPGTAALQETERWVVPNYVEVKQMWRLTLTADAINLAANVMFLVAGSDKAERLNMVLRGPYLPDLLPSQLIKPVKGNLTWLVDYAAAARI